MFTISPNYFRDRLPHPGTVDTVLLYYQYHIAVVTVPYLGTHNDSIDRLVKVTDITSNVLGIKNNAPLPHSGKAGGQMSHSYTYDPLYRLSSATGTYKGTDNKTASYTLAMGYDNMHRITSKKQHLTQSNVQFNGSLNAGYDLTYTYQKGDGHKFQLDNVRDMNYRTEETPTDSTTINNGHKYEYDANGNLVYINTSRVKRDGKEDDKASEQKFKWDEENRLLAVDENGFVSNYWYDADGERTVKTSGENEAIYVNSEFSGGNTGTARFSLYVSPYLVAGQGGKYTKHIYIGSQRIVSKLGDLASYGADPRRIPYAGNEADGLTINYKDKYAQQLQSIKDNYKTFDIPYTGKDNNDYVNGQGFCCNDGTPEAAQAKAMARAATDGNFKPNEEYEKMQFYYHLDHLGSSSYITNLDGEVVQHIEYVPFGEVFVEERNNIWNTPYLFNAKEFDEETGLYYYGARYYDPRVSLWVSTDPAQEEQVTYSSYCYTKNSPLIFVDPTGEKPTPSEAARMAAHIYGDKKDDILIGGWKKSPDNLGLNLKTSCGLKSAVYMRTDAKGKVLEYAYVTAGTEAEWADVAADLTQPFGLSKQYSNSADNAKSINSRVKGKELTFIGHSLGGGEAALNALVTDRAAITFNPAGVSDITKIKEGSWLTPFKSERNIDAYIMYTDPLNIIQDKTSIPKANGKRHYLVPTDFPSIYNGHSMDNVLKNFGVKPDKYNKE